MRASIILLLFLLAAQACTEKAGREALIETEFGSIRVLLYDETPQHRDNFVRLVNEGFYDSLLFHRVMDGFMIQGGDPDSRTAATGAPLGLGGPGYTLPAEIGFPHLRGALAAARMGDAMNPEKASNGSQFYIVVGRPVSAEALARTEAQKGFQYNEAQRQLYQNEGGAPQLDGDYTVFGEVLEGMAVVDQIAKLPKDPRNRPYDDVRMRIKMLD